MEDTAQTGKIRVTPDYFPAASVSFLHARDLLQRMYDIACVHRHGWWHTPIRSVSMVTANHMLNFRAVPF